MDLYSQKSESLPQKVIIVIFEIIFLVVSYQVLFGNFLGGIRAAGSQPDLMRNGILFAFNLVVFLRFLFTLFYFLQRRIPLEETISVPMAFGLYLLGFPLLARSADVSVNLWEIFGILFFIAGSFLNSYSEYQRKKWKKDPQHRGKLYTGGLFGVSRHVNYFGDFLWVSGYAMVTHNTYSILIPLFLFSFFYFFNIPKLETYLQTRYSGEFDQYKRQTKSFIPFIL